MPDLNELRTLNSDRVSQLKQSIADAENENERLGHIKQLFEIIQRSGSSVVDKLDDGVHISNFDEVKASLKNEFTSNFKKLVKAMDGIKLSNKEQSDLALNLFKISDKARDDDFQTIRIKKPRDRVNVINFDDIIFPDNVKVNNLDELGIKLDALKEAFNIPAPQVNVDAPIVNIPELIIPETSINIPETNLKPIATAIQKMVKELKRMQSEGMETSSGHSELLNERFDDMLQVMSRLGFPGSIKLASGSSVEIKPAQSIVTGTKTVTTAGTAVQLSTSSVACKYVMLNADEGNTGGLVFVGDSSVTALSGSQQGLQITPTANLKVEINNLNELWVDSQEDGDQLCYAYFT